MSRDASQNQPRSRAPENLPENAAEITDLPLDERKANAREDVKGGIGPVDGVKGGFGPIDSVKGGAARLEDVRGGAAVEGVKDHSV